MKAVTVLQALENFGIKIWIDGPDFCFCTNGRRIPKVLLHTIEAHQEELAGLVQDRQSRRGQLLPDGLEGVLRAYSEFKLIKSIGKIDRLTLDCAAGLSHWSGIPRGRAGDIDLSNELWVRSQIDPAKWEEFFVYHRAKFFKQLTEGKGLPLPRKAGAWIVAQCQAAREVGRSMGLISTPPNHRLARWFESLNESYFETMDQIKNPD